ncbi:unnamed protein product [Medioppia subpectinata]|uniref:Uncharacterized protein n=1 Tax=Medioppia subpectinata TaxID=1979941 RepID=A0A7R9L1D3_9ACAR|nr:unnamed protein product [Medioppia subpectinata]CAG2112503.1 unnamed protein product [Medioppia subpectinata]
MVEKYKAKLTHNNTNHISTRTTSSSLLSAPVSTNTRRRGRPAAANPTHANNTSNTITTAGATIGPKPISSHMNGKLVNGGGGGPGVEAVPDRRTTLLSSRRGVNKASLKLHINSNHKNINNNNNNNNNHKMNAKNINNNNNVVKHAVKTSERRLVIRKSHKKRLRYCFTTEKSKNTFWKDLEEGRIDVFKEDLYSRVKSRASSRGNSGENSPKQPTPTDAGSPHTGDSVANCNDNTNHTNDENCYAENGTGSAGGATDPMVAADNDDSDKYTLNADLRVKLCKTEALMAAITAGDRELARILLANGSDANATEGQRNGSTPLMVCCERNNIDMTAFLLSVGALKDVHNRNGDTALIIASRLGHDEIVKLLLNYGSNFAQTNRKGTNALRCARLSGHESTQRTLIDHISRLALSLEDQVMDTLCNTARIVNALFPIQCYSMNECQEFKLSFEFDLDRRVQHNEPGVGYILFVANTSISQNGIKCQFSGPDVIQEVHLNKTVQKPLTEGAQYVFSFLPLVRGTNELVIKTTHSRPVGEVAEDVDARHERHREANSHIKLMVCAYEIQLIANNTHNDGAGSDGCNHNKTNCESN